MRPAVIDDAIKVCGDHLAATHAFGTEIEGYLTSYLVVRICAEFEEEIERMVIERAKKSGDAMVEAFVRSAIGALFRSVLTSEIAGLLNRFGPESKEKFTRKVSGTRTETFYNNIVVNRHGTAHKGSVTMTFRELLTFYEEAHVVLDVVREVLLPPEGEVGAVVAG